MRRVNVIGASGTGKTTVGRRIAGAIGGRLIEIDALHFESDWVEVPDEELARRVAAAVEGTDAWVADGNYASVRHIIWAVADTVVWLDYPLRTALRQLTRRTVGRLVRREELWHGNRESWRGTFASRDSLYWWVLKTHRARRRTTEEWLARPEYADLVVHRFRTPAETERWLRALEAGVSPAGGR
jgi:adenylate kinase family enzyme